MKRFGIAALVLLPLAAFAPEPAQAITWGAEAFGAFSTHTMSDWKDLTHFLNQVGFTIDDPTSSWGGGLGLRVWPSSSWMIAATWEPIILERKEQVTGVVLDFDAQSFQLTSGYFFPAPEGAKFGVGAGVAYYSLHGHSPDSTFFSSVDLTGNTVGFHFAGMGEWTVSRSFAITGTVGYRIAKITDTKFDGKSAAEEFGAPIPNTDTDYSGLMVRAGLAYYLPQSHR